MITRNLFQKMGMLAVMGIAAASCSQDELTGNRGLNGNAVKFSIVASSTPAEDTPETRALNADDTPVMLLAPGGQDTLYLHPWVTENCAAPSAPPKKGMTRGEPVEDKTDFEEICKSFGVTAYTQDDKLFMQNEKISKVSNGVWSPDETYFWPAKASLDFYAHAPYGNTTMTITNNKEITFNYIVPDQATEQPDIMFAHVTASKETLPGSTVSLGFKHALAGVKFVAKDVTNCTVKSITLKNLYGQGSCTYSTETETETFAWTPSGDKKEFSQTFDVTLKEQENGEQQITDENPETTFMLIPQLLKDVTVEVQVETTEGTFTLTGSLAQTGEWKAGHIYTYAISTESINWVYEFEVTPDITLPLGETQAQYTVTSYRYRKGNSNVKEPVAWSAKNTGFSETDQESGSPVETVLENILSDFTYQDENPSETQSYSLTVTNTTLKTNYDGDLILKNNQQKGSPENPYDLSTEGGTISKTTANCYVVNAAGTYKLPLVYGNAIKNGVTNLTAYSGGAFKDYKDQTISGSDINGADDAVLVWSDGFYLFKDIKLSDDKKYLIFTIDSDYMQQANGVLAVRDANDNIMWSWHIWVTERNVYETIAVKDYTNNNITYGMMPCNLGWVDGKMVYYNQRGLTFTFTQNHSGITREMTVQQEGAKFDYKDVGSTYYQWGRKDPLVALKNWDQIGANEYRPHQVGKEDYSYRTEAKRVSIGESIQHPNVYYVRNGTIGNWNSNPVGTLWNNQSNGGTIDDVSSTKTIYDPSPRGFKVPVPKAFAVFVNGCSESPGGTKPNVGTLNGTSNVGVHKNQYEVYTQSKSGGEMITLTGTGQRADLDKKLPAYTEGNTDAELGGLWAMYGVYFMTCVPVKPDEGQAYTLAIRRDVDAPEKCTVYTYGFIGNMTMARPVRPIKETN